ncbi:zinc finger protein 142-like isoform X2 [Rhinatrema bivittatum]|uniref:zinc finger protein 142-like isoform X2 n=1 Tax=Rhinatrema bivittatum TaxID=194408 RepID=UPI00112CC476|nr:zinc finger protein 142-like isoform X2 [Rhinatrema bivittatum]
MTEEAAAPVCSAVDGLHVGLLLVPSAASRSYFRESGETAEQGGAGADVTSPLTVQPSGLQPGASAGEERASPERAAGEVFVGASGAVSRSEAVGSPSGHAAGKEAARKRKISSLEEQKGWEAEVGRTQEKGEPTASREEDETGRSTGDVEEGTEYLFKTHMCSECKRCFRKRTHLVEHLHLHFPDPSLQCPNCQKFFTSRSKLKIHLMREVGEKSHCCPLCDYSSVEKNALNRHMACMHDNISNFYSDVYPCPVCEQKFQLSHALKDHLKSHKTRRQQLLRCFQEGCDCSTEDRREFVRHLKEAHGAKAVECRYHACSLLFPTRDAMEAHRKSHYAFHCEQCDFVCSNKHAFRAHKRRGHAGSEELRCDFCPYTTFNPVEFADHVGKMHANEKIHKCGECDFATAHKRVLHRHTLLHTGEKPHKCALCDFTCRDLSYLSKHMLTHSSDKNYMCTECGYVTKWKHYLSVHMRKHTGDLRYQCNQCSYRCHRADQLSSHKLRHQGKSLICEVCGFACKRKYELQKHMQAKHSQNYQVPVFQCQYCSYQTKYKQALLNHENCKHTKQKLFRCALCVYHTFSNTSLFFHKRKAHGYVPGDKDWLENYASKEMEVSSANLLLCYDVDAALRSGSGARARGELWQKDKLSAVDNESCQQAFAVPLFVLPHSPMEKNIEMAGTEEPGKPDACAKVSSATDSADLSHSTLDGLHARGGSPLSFEHLSKEPSPAQLVSMETLRAEADTAHKDLASSEILVLEDSDNSEEGLPDFEEGNDLQEEEQSRPEHGIDCCPEEASDGSSEESTQCDSQSNCEQQSPARGKTSCAAGLPMRDELVQSQETWASTLTAASSACELSALDQRGFPEAAARDVSSEEREEGSQSESVLRALRKQDKEQAETLVLEGRVQMLVVQSGSQVFRCEKCSYITRKEKSLLLHTKAGCQSRKSPLVCKACGASFKQQRGLHTHLAKKCPVTLKGSRAALKPTFPVRPGEGRLRRQSSSRHRKTSLGGDGAAVGCSSAGSGGEMESGENGRDDLAGFVRAIPSFPQEAAANPSVQQCSSETLTGKTIEETDGGVSRAQSLLQNDTRSVDEGQASEQYGFEQGKFHCRSCSFVCSRASSISSHIGEGCRKLGPFSCSLCSEAFRSRRMLKQHRDEKHKGPESVDSAAVEGSRQTGAPEDEASPSHNQTGDSKESSKARDEDQGTQARVSRKMRLACSQQVVVKAHRRKGCKTSAELRCLLCPFACQCAKALKHHKQLHRKYGGSSKRPQLQCRQCDFTCKQSRCMKQHVRIRHEGMKPHKCRFCDFSTTRRYRLEAHESLHTGLGRIACDVCSQTFGTNSKLRIHKLRVHEKKPTHFCPLCDYSGYSQNDITRHTKSCHSGELSSACPQCPARFSSETALKQHTLRKHEEKVCFSCPRCAFTCHSEATLKCHLQKLHPHLECGACGETFGRREDLEEHKKSHFGHHCQHCSFACKERQQLVHHYVEEHETGEERPFACTFCSFTCCHQLVFDYHMKGHGGTRLYKCADCEYATKNRQKITWHIRIHTGEKPYKCHLCKYACADPSRLKYHMRIHKEERKYLCPDCGYKCKWVNQLKYHRTKHTGIKPYQCDKCDYRTNRADALRIHKETRHQDARTFICEQCGKAFKTRFLLKTHLKKHSEDKPYVCNVCLRNFRWAAGLRHHYLIHTKQHPFYCRFCTYKAKQKFQVIKHIQRHHPQDAGEDPRQGVGKDPSTSTIHLQDVQLERLPEESAGGDGPGT